MKACGSERVPVMAASSQPNFFYFVNSLKQNVIRATLGHLSASDTKKAGAICIPVHFFPLPGVRPAKVLFFAIPPIRFQIDSRTQRHDAAAARHAGPHFAHHCHPDYEMPLSGIPPAAGSVFISRI